MLFTPLLRLRDFAMAVAFGEMQSCADASGASLGHVWFARIAFLIKIYTRECGERHLGRESHR